MIYSLDFLAYKTGALSHLNCLWAWMSAGMIVCGSAINWQTVTWCTPVTPSKASGTTCCTLVSQSTAAVAIENGEGMKSVVFIWSIHLLFILGTWRSLLESEPLLFRQYCSILSPVWSSSCGFFCRCRRMAQRPEGSPGGLGMRSLNRRPCTSPSWHTWALASSPCLATSETSSAQWA